nr:unnamed protein product [Callosobruchus chinensis]CAH7769422.1 unnamed protein product [Callosobruchus chinensis]
MYNFHICS